MVLTPSPSSFSLVEAAIKKARYGVYDMEIMNSLFGSTCLLLPHRIYALLSGEYRSNNHDPFLNLDTTLGVGEGGEREREDWNPDMVINDAKFVHFSDHPLGKPWMISEQDIEKVAPKCNKISGWEEECRTRDVWLDLYEDFRERRQVGFKSRPQCRDHANVSCREFVGGSDWDHERSKLNAVGLYFCFLAVRLVSHEASFAYRSFLELVYSSCLCCFLLP